MNYNNEIKRLRELAGKTQAFLAGKLKCTPAYVVNIENGRKKVSRDQFVRIIKYLGFKLLEKTEKI